MDSQQLRRRPVNIANLPPQVQAAMANGQPFTAEDGSVVYPDGTATGAGDSPDDFISPYAAAPPQMTNFNPGAQPLPAAAPAGPAPKVSPFADPMYDRYFTVANAGMPGQPGALGGGPLPTNGMPALGAPAADVAPTRNVQLSVEGPRVDYNGGAPYGGKSGSAPTMPGRMGRRQSTTSRRRR